MAVELLQILNITYIKIILRYFFEFTKRKMTFVKFPPKAQISLMVHFKCCHKFPVRVTDREDNLGPYSAKEDLGRTLTKHTEGEKPGDPVRSVGHQILPSRSKYDLVIFLEHKSNFSLQ